MSSLAIKDDAVRWIMAQNEGISYLDARCALLTAIRIAGKIYSTLPRPKDLDALKSAAIVGVYEAARRFDPRKGFTFIAYVRATVSGKVRNEYRDTQFLGDRPMHDAQEQAQVASIDASYNDPGEDDNNPEPLAEMLADPSLGPEALAIASVTADSLGGWRGTLLRMRARGKTQAEVGRVIGCSQVEVGRREQALRQQLASDFSE